MKFSNAVNDLVVKFVRLDFLNDDTEMLVMERLYPMDFRAYEYEKRELWLDVLDNPPRQKTYGGAVAHVLTHSHIHRGEILHMLNRLGVPNLIEGDVLSWESQAR